MRASLARGIAVLAALALAPAGLSATWSIVAVDLRTGRLVIASATCVEQALFRTIPAAGLMDIQAIMVPGMGVAAAQATADRTRANQRLIAEQLRAGTDPSTILEMLRSDPQMERRQFAVVDARGRIAAYSGTENDPAVLSRQGRAAGTDIYYSVQGNILASEQVVHVAAAAIEGGDGDILDRVMAAMDAADAAGGDRRCTCETEPAAAAACEAKTAHVAYLLAADPDDAEGEYFLYIDVTNENIAPDENANPVVTLRARFDAWRRRGPNSAPQS